MEKIYALIPYWKLHAYLKHVKMSNGDIFPIKGFSRGNKLFLAILHQLRAVKSGWHSDKVFLIFPWSPYWSMECNLIYNDNENKCKSIIFYIPLKLISTLRFVWQTRKISVGTSELLKRVAGLLNCWCWTASRLISNYWILDTKLLQIPNVEWLNAEHIGLQVLKNALNKSNTKLSKQNPKKDLNQNGVWNSLIHRLNQRKKKTRTKPGYITFIPPVL